MMVSYASKFMAQLDPFDRGPSKVKRTDFEPINYTSLAGFMFMNYLLLALLIALTLLALWEACR